MQKITIPKPCHEDWSGMTAEKNGRFCGSCQKTVVDFTAMADAEILAFFVAKAAETEVKGVCGRFKTEQLERELHTKSYILPLSQQNTGQWRNNLQRLAQASLLASVLYFSSCTNGNNERAVGNIKVTSRQEDSLYCNEIRSQAVGQTHLSTADSMRCAPFTPPPPVGTIEFKVPTKKGKVKIPRPPKTQNISCKTTIGFTPPSILTGDVEISKTPPKISDFDTLKTPEKHIKMGEMVAQPHTLPKK
jgi:hypothetical protein